MTSKNNLVRYAALFDVHCGYEFNEEADYDKTLQKFVPSHDEKLLRKVYKFLHKDWKPDYVIFGGDQINLSCISRWTEKKPRMIEGRTIAEDFDIFHKLCGDFFSSMVTKTVWLEGNHEERLRELVNKYPQLAGSADCVTMLTNRNLYPEMVYSGKLWRPPGAKVSFTHGHIVLSGAGFPAKNLVQSYHRSVRAGHLHTHQTWTERIAVDAQDYHTGVIVPPMCRPNLPYAKNKPASNQQGFLIGEYDCVTGNFWDTVITAVNGEFVYNGKRY